MRKGQKIHRPSKLDPHIHRIREWTTQGWRIGRIAQELGYSKQAVHDAMVRHDIPRHPKHSCPGEHNPAWKGGRYLDDDGYVLVYAPTHPYADKAHRVREHRLVMETMVGRYLLPTEVVDHVDGIRSHNDPANLRLFASNSDHLAVTLKGRVPQWTAAGLARIQQSRFRRAKRQQSPSHAALKTDVPG